jgi:hypothetical protein
MKQNKHYKKLRRLVRGGTTRLQKPALLPAKKPSETLREPSNGSLSDGGVLRLDKSNHLPTALAEASEDGPNSLMPGPLVITITLAAIIFIAIITWFISQMPNK